MAELVRDLSNWLEVNTATYKNVPDLDNDKQNADGSPRIWIATPPSPAGEGKIERIKRANSELMARELRFLKARWERLQGLEPSEDAAADTEEMDPVLLGQQWAPLLAAYITNVTLDPEDLARDFHGYLIKALVEDIQGFFADMKARMVMPKSNQR